MLVCPQCKFENPNTNKFCQQCGTSLTHKTCECGTQVPVNAETCHNCGAFTGTVWWAIISKDPDFLGQSADSQIAPLEGSKQVDSNITSKEVSQQVPIDLSDRELPRSPTLPLIEESADEVGLVGENTQEATGEDSSGFPISHPPSPNPVAVYLDPQQRYRLLEPQHLEKIGNGRGSASVESFRVLDCQPFQKSLLEALMEQQQSNLQRFESSERKAAPSFLNSGKVLGIPAIAQPYLALKEFYRQTLPEVHDAWHQDGESVVLLEDRSGWELIGDLWGSEEIPTLQILSWLGEITQLWESLEPWGCRQSLLEITNLRVDEDGVLGLICLYPEPREQPPTLQDLGQMWQMLFNQSQRTQLISLGGVFRQMCSNEIGTIHELRSQLEAIAHELQTPAKPVQNPESTEEVSMIPPESTPETPLSLVTAKSPVYESSPPGEVDDPTIILPMQLVSLDDAGCTDVGHLRPHNEDCFGILTQIKKQENPMGKAVQARGLYILCDGMGGHEKGEIASGMAVERLKRYFQDNWSDQLPTEETVRDAVRAANQSIYDVNQENARSGSGRMGTTLVMLLIQNTKAAIAHVGDSRIYRLTRLRGLEQLTVDHEVGQREIRLGVDPIDAYARPDAYQLTQALGPRDEKYVNPDVLFLELNEDTLFVLCSDGLSDNDLLETHWQTHLAPLLSSRANLEQGILQLRDLANEHNSHDNITAILVRVKVRPNFEQQQQIR